MGNMAFTYHLTLKSYLSNFYFRVRAASSGYPRSTLQKPFPEAVSSLLHLVYGRDIAITTDSPRFFRGWQSSLQSTETYTSISLLREHLSLLQPCFWYMEGGNRCREECPWDLHILLCPRPPVTLNNSIIFTVDIVHSGLGIHTLMHWCKEDTNS